SAAGLALAAPSPEVPAATNVPAPMPTMKEIAEEAFASHCAGCHGLVGTEGWQRLTPEEFYTVLRRGQMQEPATGLDDGVLHALPQAYGNPAAERDRPANGGAVACTSAKPDAGSGATWPGFSPDASNTRALRQPIGKAAIQGARLKWTFAFP